MTTPTNRRLFLTLLPGVAGALACRNARPSHSDPSHSDPSHSDPSHSDPRFKERPSPVQPSASSSPDRPTNQSARMPVLFVGHGSPMNAISDNPWSRALRELALELPAPRAVLVVSAHWFGPGTLVTANESPKTIHDFGNFPRALHEMQYPAPGSPELARRIVELVEGATASLDWGLDHGSWSVLVHLLPEANCPVVQLSLDASLPTTRHVELGRALEPLRDEGVLILASGNATHNLRHAFASMQSGVTETPAWAARFDADLAAALTQRDRHRLEAALETDDGRLCHPTPEHYLPLLYAFGASTGADALTFPIEGFDLSSLSMRAARFG